MFNLGIQELAVIFIIALLFIGPKQLPELAKTLGRVFRDFKRATNEVTDSLQREARQIQEIEDEKNAEAQDAGARGLEALPESESVARSKYHHDDRDPNLEPDPNLDSNIQTEIKKDDDKA